MREHSYALMRESRKGHPTRELSQAILHIYMRSLSHPQLMQTTLGKANRKIQQSPARPSVRHASTSGDKQNHLAKRGRHSVRAVAQQNATPAVEL